MTCSRALARKSEVSHPHDETRVSISEGLLRAVDEARFLSLEAECLDATIGDALSQVGRADATRLQNADLLRQGLDGLAQYLEALTSTIDDKGTCCPAAASAGLLMAAQSKRLQKAAPSEQKSTAQDCSEFWGD